MLTLVVCYPRTKVSEATDLLKMGESISNTNYIRTLTNSNNYKNNFSQF